MKKLAVVALVGLCSSGCLVSEDLDPFQLQDVSMADGTFAVRPLETIRITLTRDVSLGSLDGVRLMRGLWPVDVEITYNPLSHELLLDPVRPYELDTEYTLVIDGLQSARGQFIAPDERSFTTVLNPLAYNEAYDASGNLIGYQTLENDEHGRNTANRIYGPGADGVLGTPDDVLSFLQLAEYNDFQDVFFSYDDPGPDGAWETEDDHVLFFSVAWTDPDTGIRWSVSANDPGPDGLWLTADDVITGYTTTEPLEGGFRHTEYSDPGADGTWNTADDVIDFFFQAVTDLTSRVTQNSFGGGADGVFGTPDDDGIVAIEALNEFGFTDTLAVYNDRGPDGVFFTADDVLSQDRTYTYGDHGELMLIHEVSTAFGDSYEGFRHDENQLETLFMNIADPGPDAEYGTDDDIPAFYGTSAHDALGGLTMEDFYSDAGPDAAWFTADDLLGAHRDFDPDR